MFLTLVEPETVNFNDIIFEEEEEDDTLDYGYGEKTERSPSKPPSR